MKFTETQIAIRRRAMDPKDREHARKLANPSNYYIRRARVIVDADCDFREWGTRYHVVYDGGPGFTTIGSFETVGQADAHITERATALDGDDCTEWVWCGVPCPEGFNPEG